MHKIIMISGKQGSGKTTLTKELLRYFKSRKIPALELRFAATIYKIHDAALEVMDNLGFETMKIDGELLQYLGTEWGRKRFGESVWVDAVKRQIAEHVEPTVFIISDCRFRNEFDAFPEALRVRLTCPQGERERRAEKWRDNVQHPSEIDLDNYAESEKFDIYLDTFSLDTIGCATLVMAKLDKSNWVERRALPK